MARLDIIIFGASGFTGKLAVENMVNLCCKEEYRDVRWGIAGRSLSKLQTSLQEIHIKKPDFDTKNVPILVANAEDDELLLTMTRQANVLLNATGPYTIMGESVVKACLNTRTHYIDMSAEVYYTIKLYKEYNRMAEDANIVIITGCGFTSVPCDMGFVHLEKEFTGKLQSVECYMRLIIPERANLPGRNCTMLHYGTWASLIYELKNFRKSRQLKLEMFPEITKQAPASEKSFFHKRNRKCWFPYPGPNQDTVDMTQEHLHRLKNRSVAPFRIFMTMPKMYHFLLIPVFLFYYYACFMKCFRKLLWKFPRFFTMNYMSHKGPSSEMMNETGFEYTFIGRGVDQNQQTLSKSVKVSGYNPYGISGFVFVMSAITLIKDGSNIPRGGVLTSGAAFYDTHIIKRFNENGIHFQSVEEK